MTHSLYYYKLTYTPKQIRMPKLPNQQQKEAGKMDRMELLGYVKDFYIIIGFFSILAFILDVYNKRYIKNTHSIQYVAAGMVIFVVASSIYQHFRSQDMVSYVNIVGAYLGTVALFTYAYKKSVRDITKHKGFSYIVWLFTGSLSILAFLTFILFFIDSNAFLSFFA